MTALTYKHLFTAEKTHYY